MARVARLTPRFRARLQACGVTRRSEASAAVGATIASLMEADTLPAHADIDTFLPPTTAAIARRVPGRNLWIWYEVNDADELVILTITRTPPVPS